MTHTHRYTYTVVHAPDDTRMPWCIYKTYGEDSVPIIRASSQAYAEALARTLEGHRYEYVPSHVKPVNRQSRTLAFWEQLKAIVSEYDVIGTRSVFYQAETRGLVPKDDGGYRKVQEALVDMRRDGFIPYDKICDTGRVRSRPFCVQSMHHAIKSYDKLLRYDYWADQPRWCELWVEKEGLLPVLEPVKDKYGIFLAALKGFESLSFLSQAAAALRKVNRPTTIFYLGDHDPGGWEIARTLESDLRSLGADVEVRQLLVLPWQIDAFNLSTRKAKRSDTRRKAFIAEFGSDRCVEVDAVPPKTMRLIASTAIESVIDWDAWYRAEMAEQAIRETSESVMGVWRNMLPGQTINTVTFQAAAD